MGSTGTEKKKPKDGAEERHDPFAVDIFGGGSGKSIAPGFVLESVKSIPLPAGVTRDWAVGLETITDQAEGKEIGTPEFPGWLEREIENSVLPVIAELAGSVESPDFEILSYEDVSFDSAMTDRRKAGEIVVRFGVGGAEGALILSAEFASGLIGKILGEDGLSRQRRHKLSSVELAICEYLSAATLSALNEGLEEQFRLQLLGVDSTIIEKERSGRRVEIAGDLKIGNLSGMVTILVQPSLLRSLNSQFDSSQDENGRSVARSKKLDRFVGESRLQLVVGKTSVQAVDIPFLEADDIVLVERPAAAWWNGKEKFGRLNCKSGTASNLVMSGECTVGDGPGGVRFNVSEILVEAPHRFYSRIAKSSSAAGDNSVKEGSKVMPQPEDKTGNAQDPSRETAAVNTDDGLVALENVLVDLRVQVAGRKISLSELGKLKAGQIIDLGCRPEDPVELVAENSDRPVAAGELVKIQEQLGVRITKVFV